MTLAVGNVCNQVFGLCRGPGADVLHNIDVAHLVVVADIVNLDHAAIMNNQVNVLAVFLHIESVTDIQTLAIYGNELVVQGISNHQVRQPDPEVPAIRLSILIGTVNRHSDIITKFTDHHTA